MVNTLLLVVSGLTLLIWLIQEFKARPEIHNNLSSLVEKGTVLPIEVVKQQAFPSWSDLALKAVMGAWFLWAATVFLLKDGDFALVLVVLTFLSGIIYGIDAFLFEKKRREFVASAQVTAFFEKYDEQQRADLEATFAREMVVAEYGRSFFSVLLLVLVLRSFLFEPFQIPSASMVPTLEIGDYILVNKYTYGLRLPVVKTKILSINEPERGDVMVFFPPNDNRYFIKRVIGLPGDTISYNRKQLTVNGEPVSIEFVAEMASERPISRIYKENLSGVSHEIRVLNRLVPQLDSFTVTVKPGHYFMMGDNRGNSSDSRVWGQVPQENVVGKAVAIWMHWPSFTQLPSLARTGGIQ